MMKGKHYMILALTGALLLSCDKDNDDMLEVMEQQQALAKMNTNTLRAKKLRPGGFILDGEKGRDHRDNMGIGEMSIRIGATRELQVGDIFVTAYNEKTNEYSAEIYWGEEMDEETKKMLRTATIYMRFMRSGYGQICQAVCGNNYPNYYTPGDKFVFSGDVCWTCTDVEISMNYKYPDLPYCTFYKGWSRPFSSLRYIIKDNQDK
jgi:hypothetical protein